MRYLSLLLSLTCFIGKQRPLTVADPGFDLRGGVDIVHRGGGRKSLEVLKVEVKVIFSVFWPYFY